MTALWPFEPEPDCIESLIWKTDVIRCKAGEQRISTQPYPSLRMSYAYQWGDELMSRARQISLDVGEDQPILVPLWWEKEYVGSVGAHSVTLPVPTTHRSYTEGGYLMVFDDNLDCEACLIDTVASELITLDPWVVSAYQDAWVMPLATAHFDGALESQRMAAPYFTASAAFVVDGVAQLEPPIGIAYRSYPLSVIPPVVPAAAGQSWARRAELFQGAGGATDRKAAALAEQVSSMSWIKLSDAETYDLRAWLHGRRGKWRPFWMPSWAADITITASITGGDTTVEIAAIGYNDLFPNPTDFVIIDTSGGMTCFRATTAAPGSAGHEVVTVASAFGASISLASISRTSKLTLSRLASDTVEIQHTVAGQSSVTVQLIEAPE